MERERIIELPKITDSRGSLTFAETGQCIPFDISHISWFDEGQASGNDETVLLALSGMLEIDINGRSYILNQPNKALYIPQISNSKAKKLSEDMACLIISSRKEVKDISKSETVLGKYTVSNCSVIKLLDKDADYNLLENIPFQTKRVFYIYNTSPDQMRGMHAHKVCHEILIAANGSFTVDLDDGVSKKTVVLDNPACGLHIPPGIWAVERNYSPDATCLVFASDRYDAENYINSYPEFIKYRQHGD